MNYKNMKIEINESQPLDDVVRELERLGYEFRNSNGVDFVFITTYREDKSFILWDKILFDPTLKFTTLAELKEM